MTRSRRPPTARTRAGRLRLPPPPPRDDGPGEAPSARDASGLAPSRAAPGAGRAPAPPPRRSASLRHRAAETGAAVLRRGRCLRLPEGRAHPRDRGGARQPGAGGERRVRPVDRRGPVGGVPVHRQPRPQPRGRGAVPAPGRGSPGQRLLLRDARPGVEAGATRGVGRGLVAGRRPGRSPQPRDPPGPARRGRPGGGLRAGAPRDRGRGRRGRPRASVRAARAPRRPPAPRAARRVELERARTVVRGMASGARLNRPGTSCRRSSIPTATPARPSPRWRGPSTPSPACWPSGCFRARSPTQRQPRSGAWAQPGRRRART